MRRLNQLIRAAIIRYKFKVKTYQKALNLVEDTDIYLKIMEKREECYEEFLRVQRETTDNRLICEWDSKVELLDDLLK